jgi:hypothetical protein
MNFLILFSGIFVELVKIYFSFKLFIPKTTTAIKTNQKHLNSLDSKATNLAGSEILKITCSKIVVAAKTELRSSDTLENTTK